MAIARVGDVFDLGPHRLICGSATDPETLRRLMEGDPSARLVWTDEPYNVPIAGYVTGSRHREFVNPARGVRSFIAIRAASVPAIIAPAKPPAPAKDEAR